MPNDQRVPKVFVSYSHDSSEHKQWVSGFAKRLVENGIEVLFDQWDLGFGDDVPKYMEKAVKEADRVLMICSEKYVHKANDGVGGVGYEAMVVTGELVKDLGTSKFIPIVRQQGEKKILPTSVDTRKYVDLSSEATFDQNFDDLLRDLHKAPVNIKPPMGKNPFSDNPVFTKGPDGNGVNLVPTSDLDFENVEEIYKNALQIAEQDDILKWRILVGETRRYVNTNLLEWRSSSETQNPQTEEVLNDQVLKGLSIYCPLINIALAGLGSRNSRFVSQISLLEDILFIKDWNRSGLTVLTDLPFAGGFIYQSLHGAMCLLTGQLSLAIRFIRSKLETPGDSTLREISTIHPIMGWPRSLGGNSSTAWKFLIALPEKWPWINTIFGDKESFLTALIAYYMGLNVNDYCPCLMEGNESLLESLEKGERLSLDIPLHFLGLDRDVERRAYRLFTEDIGQTKDIWRSLKISDEKFVKSWGKWVDLCKSYLSQEFLFFHEEIAHRKLGEEIAGDR